MSSELTPNLTLIEACKKILALALPMSGTQFINVASSFFCMVMLAKLGAEVLAASALMISTQMSIIVTGISILFSLSVLIGHAYGARNFSMIGNFVQQGWLLGILISIPIMLIFWHIDAILIFFGQDKNIAQIVKEYFHAYVWAVIPALLGVCNQQFGYAIHKRKLMIFSSMLSISVLLITAYTLIFGKFGLPKLGIAGLGYAMAAQSTFFFIFTTCYFYFHREFKSFDLFNFRVHHNWSYLSKMFKIGGPISFQTGGEMLSLLASATMVGWIGTIALAATQVVNQYYFLIIIPLFSLAQASGILVGQAVGSKQFNVIKKLGNAALSISLLMTLLVALLFLLAPRPLASLYLHANNANVIPTLHLIILLFAIIAFTQIADGIRNTLTGLLRGLFDTKFSMYITLLVLWIIGIPLSYFLAFKLHLGVIGIALGGACGMFLGASIMFLRWRKIIKKYD